MCVYYIHCYIKHTVYNSYIHTHYTVYPIPYTMKIPYTHYSATHHYITTGTPVMRRLVVPAFMSNTFLCSSRSDLYIGTGTQHKYTYYEISMQYCTINLYYSTLLHTLTRQCY